MLQVDNRTPFNAALAVFADRHGVETAYVAVKAAFEFGERGLVPTKRVLPLLPGDMYWGDPQATGLRAAGELTLARPATDIAVLGHAVAPRPGQQVMKVAVQVGPVVSELLVQGPRRWQRHGLVYKPSEPAPFERVQLRWELAFGGFERMADGSEPKEFEPRNPVGCGFIGRKESGFADRALPQIEHPDDPLQDPGQRCTPVGWGPIPPFWAPRREWAGTYGAAWQKRRAPFLPQDFQDRFLNTMPPAMVAPGHLQGGELVRVAGCRPRGEPLAFELPRCTIELSARFRGAEVPLQARIESVIIEPDHPRLQMLWCAALAVDKHLLKLEQVRVECPEYPKDEYLGTQMRRAA